jgi:hypothetical protein
MVAGTSNRSTTYLFGVAIDVVHPIDVRTTPAIAKRSLEIKTDHFQQRKANIKKCSIIFAIFNRSFGHKVQAG